MYACIFKLLILSFLNALVSFDLQGIVEEGRWEAHDGDQSAIHPMSPGVHPKGDRCHVRNSLCLRAW